MKKLRKMYIRHIFCMVLIIIVGACSSVKKMAVGFDVKTILQQSDVFSQHFTGFALYDLEESKLVSEYQSTKRFTPASNTKLLTMYAVMRTFSDSLPSLLYQKTSEGTFIKPVGDPTFLHPAFGHWQSAASFLAEEDTIRIVWPEIPLAPYGAGWAWEDYAYDFQPQITWWPIYGNTVSISGSKNNLEVVPPFFNNYVETVVGSTHKLEVHRNRTFNVFSVLLPDDSTTLQKHLPFEYSQELLASLLQDTLQKPVRYQSPLSSRWDTLYNAPTSTALKQMIQPSDNLLAEQLLLMAAWYNGFDNVPKFIAHVKSVWLNNLSDMVWVDGSGLSRYNLVTPMDMIRLLNKCNEEFGWEAVTEILPSGGIGTLKGRYEAETPFVYAKTGTLSNNHNLSGFLVTRSGRRMIFSLMNNHFVRDKNEVKTAMEDLLTAIRDAY